MIDHLKVAAELSEAKDKVWGVLGDVHNVTPLEDDEHLEAAIEYLNWAFDALNREIEKQEELHGKDWDTPIGDY